VTEINDENYDMANNKNAWSSGSPYCPASPVTGDTGLAPRSCKRTANRDIRENSPGSSSSADDENDEISDDDNIMSPHNL
jgi:hypothetical protein